MPPTLLTTMSRRPKVVLRRGGERADLVGLVEVGDDDVRLAAGRLDPRRGLAQLLLGARGDDDVGPGLGQRERGRGADAPPGAGDDGDLAVDPEPVQSMLMPFDSRAAGRPAEPAEERRVAERQAAAVALRGHAGRGAPGRVQAGDRRALEVEHLAGGRGVQAAEGERRVDERRGPQVERGQRPAQRRQVRRALVEQRVVAGRGVLVVVVEGRDERTGRQPDLRLEFGRGLADPGGADVEPVRAVVLLVDDQVGLAVLVQQRGLPDAALVGVLVDEALAEAVDDDAVHEPARGVERQRALDGVHPLDARAGGLGHPDAAAVVALGAEPQRGGVHGRRVLLDHLGAVDEAAGGQDDTGAGADRDRRLAVARRHDAADPSLAVDDQALGAGVVRRRGHPRRSPPAPARPSAPSRRAGRPARGARAAPAAASSS